MGLAGFNDKFSELLSRPSWWKRGWDSGERNVLDEWSIDLSHRSSSDHHLILDSFPSITRVSPDPLHKLRPCRDSALPLYVYVMRRESGFSSPGCHQVSSEDDGASCSLVEIRKLGDTRLAAPLPGGFVASPGPQIMSFGVPEAACSLTALSNRDTARVC